MTHILYAAPLSLYSGKARSYLDWKGVDYREQLAVPDIYRDVIVPGVGRPVIPVLRTEADDLLQDTTLIIDHFEAAESGPGVYPQTPRQRLAALLLELFGDEWLVIPAMHYRWNYNEEWAYAEFGKVALPDGSPEEQYETGRKRAGPFRGSLPMLGVTPETIPAIEESYVSLLHDLDAHFAQHPFLFGTRPSIGDFGLIGPLYAHLYRDPASGEIMEREGPRVAEWVRRMIDVDEPLSGEFLPDDEIPATLLPVLRRQMDEQMPHLETVAKMLGAWGAANDGVEPPRAIGMADFAIGDTHGQRLAFPYSLWMLQRVLDFYRSTSGADRDACDALLSEIGGDALGTMQLPVRLDFSHYKLTIER